MIISVAFTDIFTDIFVVYIRIAESILRKKAFINAELETCSF